MKFNWGKGILVFIVLFMSFILILVYKCTQLKTELVSDKYYEQEINYQKQIDKMNNASKLEEDVKINYNNHEFVISYPASIDATKLSGEINFYKPDNSASDFKINVKADHENLQHISSGKISRGLWNVQINWAASGVSYYHEQKIIAN